MSEGQKTILLVDDDEVFRPRLGRAFRERGFDVQEASDGESALELAATESPEFAVVDLRMAGMNGLDVVQGLAEIDETTNIVVLTGYGSIATALEAVRRGATHYLTKPADTDDLIAAFGRRELAPNEAPEVADEAPSLARVEWEHINRVLADCGGNISQAARTLGIHRRSLQRKLSKYPAAR